MQQSAQPSTVPARAVPGTVHSERIMAPNADIVMQFYGEPTWETYDFLEKYVSLRKSVMKPSGI